jgi:transketolase
LRDVCHRMVHELACQDERVVFIGSDLSPGLLNEMKVAYPDRHYMEGVTEQNVVSIGAAMAMDGMIPYVNTIATFLTRRAYEQIVIDCGEHDLPVRLIGNGGGLVYAPLGPTHIAYDDIALMRLIPGMTVVAPLNDHEMRTFMQASLHWAHPIYIRLSKSWMGEAKLPDVFEIGKGVPLLWGATGLLPVLIVSTGVASGRALEAGRLLEAEGIPCHVLHYPTVKPLDVEFLIASAREACLVVTVEEHSIIGGLGSAVLEYLSAHRVLIPTLRLGIPDVYPKSYGNQETQMEEFQLLPHQIVRTIKEVCATNKDRIDDRYRS